MASEQATEYVFVSRYDAIGGLPDGPVCDECEGMGCFPVCRDDPDPALAREWLLLDDERRSARGFLRQLWRHKELWFWRSMFADLFRYGLSNWACDEWHFVPCNICNGGTKRASR